MVCLYCPLRVNISTMWHWECHARVLHHLLAVAVLADTWAHLQIFVVFKDFKSLTYIEPEFWFITFLIAWNTFSQIKLCGFPRSFCPVLCSRNLFWRFTCEQLRDDLLSNQLSHLKTLSSSCGLVCLIKKKKKNHLLLSSVRMWCSVRLAPACSLSVRSELC